MVTGAHTERATDKQQTPGVAGTVRKPTRCCPCTATGESRGPSIGLVTDTLVVSLLCMKSAKIGGQLWGVDELNGVLLSWP